MIQFYNVGTIDSTYQLRALCTINIVTINLSDTKIEYKYNVLMIFCLNTKKSKICFTVNIRTSFENKLRLTLRPTPNCEPSMQLCKTIISS